MTEDGGGFDGMSGAGARPGRSSTVPPGIRTIGSGSEVATRMVLVRHGEAVCNVTGVCGGRSGCTGLTDKGRRQVVALRDRLELTGELAGTDVLYASVLPRAVETAELLAPALVGDDRRGAATKPPRPIRECGLCELHPGEADGLTWSAYSERFGAIDWDSDPGQTIAPGRGELDLLRQSSRRSARCTGRAPPRAVGRGGLPCRRHRGLVAVEATGGRRPRGRPSAVAHPARFADHLGGRERPVAPARLQRRRPPGGDRGGRLGADCCRPDPPVSRRSRSRNRRPTDTGS